MKMLKKYKSALALVVTVFIFFKGAFTINFFSDDFFFLNISKIDSISDFFYFFYPFKGYFYRPLSTEVFYWLLHIFNNSLFFGHLITFLLFFTGIFFFYKSLRFVTKNNFFSSLTVVLFALHFTHVFQLYWLATFQEVLLFTSLSASFYFFLNKRYRVSTLLFICALLSKETALVYPLFLVLFSVAQKKYRTKKIAPHLGLFLALSVVFLFIYKYNVSTVAQIQTYSITLSPQLIINNLMWYFLWGLGFPNFMPDYFVSILKPPLPQFWSHFSIPEFKVYFPLFITYLISFTLTSMYLLAKERKQFIFFILFVFTGFAIFLLPFLPIFHKWMVRLTISLIFLSLLQAYVLSMLFRGRLASRILFACMLILYVMWNFYATKLHESSSLYQLETRFVNNADKYFLKNKNSIVKRDFIYFKDKSGGDAWSGSKKLKVTLHDQDFLDYYFPNTSLRAIYGFEEKKPPKNSYIVNSSELLK